MLDSPDFIAALGRPFTAHRLRRLSELFVDGYEAWLSEVGVSVPARSLSTMLLLESEGPLGVTEIAARLRLSHPLLIRMVKALEALGFVTAAPDEADARRRPIALTEAGRAEAKRVGRAVRILDRAYADLFAAIDTDLIAIAERVEAACAQTPFAARLARAAAIDKEELECV